VNDANAHRDVDERLLPGCEEFPDRGLQLTVRRCLAHSAGDEVVVAAGELPGMDDLDVAAELLGGPEPGLEELGGVRGRLVPDDHAWPTAIDEIQVGYDVHGT
jgi:hypothetical protein